MFLKSLTLKGFKSFAESAVLDLEPGVTVVVGPNGSGKSNVVDAIAWVLGAQAPSAVRSQKMDDVIFAGTSKRPALGRAEVSLTIDNSAGLLPIDFTEVTVTRTLFRTGESEYAINGTPCRLLDLQELLSDTGVGRQQHVIVSQGQIDAVLNARPEERRLIIEEAAGVLKYRKRKEKAERRLDATEANLTRVSDLLREVRRQLRPLERQADAARRHGSVVAELVALQRHLAGRDLVRLRDRMAGIAELRRELGEHDRTQRTELAGLDTSIMALEAQLAARGEHDLGDVLARYEALRERARGIVAVLGERQRGIERDRSAFVDRAVIATLEAQGARLRAELAEVDRDAEAMVPELGDLDRAEQALAAERDRFESDWADGVAPPSGQAAETRGELGALRGQVERVRAERIQIVARLDAAAAEIDRLDADRAETAAELSDAELAEAPLLAEVEAAEAELAAATAEVDQAVAALAEHESERDRWASRAEALALALDDARARAGTDRLADLDGVVGTLLDVVRVEPGWEAAFEAAAGEALRAVVVADLAVARRAVERLLDHDASGRVLPLRAGSLTLAAGSVGRPVRELVSGADARVDGLLDALLANAIVVDGGWSEAVDVAIAHPDLVVVTPDGGRFAAGGWVVGAAATGATAAALTEAEAALAGADAAVGAAGERRAQAGRRIDEARRASEAAAQRLDDNDGRLSSAADALGAIDRDRQQRANDREGLSARRSELADALQRDEARIAELESRLPELESAEAASIERSRAMELARRSLDERTGAVTSLRNDLEVRAAALDERRQVLGRRLAEVDERLARDAAERAGAEQQRLALDRREQLVGGLLDAVTARLAAVEHVLTDLREQRRRQSEAAQTMVRQLEDHRRARAAAEQRLGETRERTSRAEIDEAETRLRLEAAVEAVRRDLDCEPEAAIASECPELAEGVAPAARARELERELKLMGPINPLALQEYEALQERHEFLQAQVDDIRSSRRDLNKVIRAIDDEIVSVFSSAYADVSENFERLFQTLFPGGTGKLRLTDPSDLLGTGIEVEARPSGKNVRKLSLLSGGERSLTALAFLFAVFRSRPSPFYVMDEVEAALDDVNLHRFLSLVDEFRGEAQLMIVSHQKRTMEAADVLYGVTMQPGGSSKVISERVEERAARTVSV